MDKAVPKIRKIRRTPRVKPAVKRNWAVFDLETHFRYTEYTTRDMAGNVLRSILYDQPGLKGRIGIKQRDFEIRPSGENPVSSRA